MASRIFLRRRPPFVAQSHANTCWAASLETWFRAEVGYGWTQAQLIKSAGDFTLGPGGINLSGLQQVIDDATRVSTIKMFTRVVERDQDVPKVSLIIREVGYVYVAFSRPDGRGGHANVLFGFEGNSYAAMDPDPSVREVTRPHRFYFTRFPALVAWRSTSAMIGLGYTGRPPWDYL